MTRDYPTAEAAFRSDVYELRDSAATQALYRDWAESYDADLAASGYAAPARCAEALARVVEDRAAPLLDVGCGTGLSGEAFAAVGFTTLDGSDFSQEMMEVAARKGVYRALLLSDLNDPLPVDPGAYAHVAAVGVFSPAHAPASLIDQVVRLLTPGGCFVFTLNDHALSDRSYEGRLREWCDSGQVELAFKKHGPHVPGQGLGSTVYVLKRR
ncbi:methyltransferase domain-containing protein [Albimonas sp. CAU 1670]|uniref:class I SAM-dependent DNA methyltransferase n=1 Tax=Albimonas sp. CAU 1670 TaxID=3032599 RepID=UPI0023DA8AAE|nr:methyltransferase domain-containing protein [Albimonas sp. CAU 1670]MDF2231959.1 methyltransferase domain-containing protein [Albimonas sp. CAU 1670]